MGRPGRDWTDVERLIVLDDYLQSLAQGRKLRAAWTHSTAALLNRTYGSVNYKLGNFIYTRTEVLGLPKAGFDGRADRDLELFKEWHYKPNELNAFLADERTAILAAPVTVQPPKKAGRQAGHARRFFAWVNDAQKEELATLLEGNIAFARQLREEGRTEIESQQTRRTRQEIFQQGAVAAMVLEAGPSSLQKCPGCGHSRTRLNGDPLLEVHHVIKFRARKSLDPRFGVPLCPNCHVVADWGKLEDRKAVYGQVLKVLPQLIARLESVGSEEGLTSGELDDLARQGLRLNLRAR